MFKLYNKIKYIKYKLKEWNKEIFDNINQEKKNIEDGIRRLRKFAYRRATQRTEKRNISK